MPNSPHASFIQKFQDGGWIPEVVITFHRERHQGALGGCINVLWHAGLVHFHPYQHCPISENSIKCKSEVETVPQTGSTNNLTTETDIDAISVAIPMFWDKFITGVYANLKRRYIHPEFPRLRTDTGSSYNFATRKRHQGALSGYSNVLGHVPSTSTGFDNIRHWRTVSGANRK